MIPADDRGLTLGDGLFETLLARNGDLVWLDAHLDRMARGCVALGLPALDLAHARQLCEDAARTVPGRAAVRLTLTAGSGGRGLDRPSDPAPRLFATAAPAPKPSGPANLIFAKVRRNEGSPASRLKTLAYLDNILAREEALAAGADEAVMLNNRGEIACAAAANVFWIAGKQLFTPELGCGVLSGIMRAHVLSWAGEVGLRAVETAAGPDAMLAADAIFLTNSLNGVRPAAFAEKPPMVNHPAVLSLEEIQQSFIG
ncbi:MAG TPA: aminotransferase class IV [Caulobacteraceae bacterium]